MSLELHHDFTFNPDGSGRITVRWAGPLANAPDAAAFLRSEVERARGVEAWADLRCEPEGDQLVFAATAYFADVRALRFHCQGFHVSLLDFAVEPAANGGIVVASVPTPSDGSAATIPAGANDRQARELLAQEREKLAMARGFLDSMFGGLRCSAVLRLPGALVGEVRGERVDTNAVRVQYDGSQLLAVLDRLMHDDALMLRLMREGGLTPDKALDLLGDHGPVSLRCEGPALPQFDYAAEVAAAQAQFAEFATHAQLAVCEQRPAQTLEHVRVVATKIVREADSERDLCPQNQNYCSVTLTVAGDLPEPALELADASCDRLVLDDGNDVTPADEWDRRCHFPKLTKDGRTVVLDVELKDTRTARGLRGVEGRVAAMRSEGSESHDLGFPELVAGATGTLANAQLHRVDQEDENRWAFEVQVQIARARVLACELVDGDTRLPLELAGYSCCNDDSTLTYRLDGAMPNGARMVMTIAGDLSRTVFGFELRDIDWLGNPLPTDSAARGR